MPFERTSMRYAHQDGHTGCCFTQDGEKIITCGFDGDIRTWQGIDDDDPLSNGLGEYLICVLQFDRRILVSNDLNVVQAYTYPEMGKDGIEFRFTAQVNCVSVNKNFIAAGSEDTVIKVVKKDKSENEFELTGHQGPILHIDLSVNNILASSSGDGTIKIWDLKEKRELKTITDIPKVKSFDAVKYLASPSFEPRSGKCLVYPNGREIVILNCSNWEAQTILTDEKIMSDYSVCSFSCCGQFIAAGTEKGEISVWDFITQQSIVGATTSIESNRITSIVWNPKNNGEFAYCDSSGQLGTIVGCKSKNGSASKGGKSARDFIDMEPGIEDDGDGNEDDFDGMTFNEDDYDVDNENCVSLERLKNETLKANGLDAGDSDGEMKDDDNKSTRSVSVERVFAKTYTQQSAFQPGSTPANLEHRYLVWNHVGIVKAFTSDTSDGSIDVEFHDVSTHHALHMNNYLQHTMASLSSTVLALSSEASSKFVCISLGGAAGSREWSFELPDCEGIVAITATNNYVAVGTDARFVRIFTVMGTQREVLSIPGPIIALAGQNDKIMIAYHRSPASEDQHISLMLLRLFGLTLRCRDLPVYISPGKKLTWIGYSDCGSPITCDTMGLIQMYSTKTNCWYPICNTMRHTQSVSNNFFIVDVSESNQIIQAVLCRGTTYPMTNPRPMVTELPMQIPLCEIELEKSILEESLVRYSNFKVENADRVIKEAAIKLFALACRSEMEARAKELIEMIASPQLLPAAVKYASKLGRIHLADKLSELLPQFEEKEQERNKEIHEMETEAFNILQNSPLNAGLLLMQKQKESTTTPKIAPKPMVISHSKRNPFKRSINSPVTGTSSTSSNLLSHLTDKVIGFESKNTQGNVNDIERIINEDISTLPGDTEASDEIISVQSPINNENKANNEITLGSPGTFMSWYNRNKEDLKIKHPDVTAAELTKLAMKEFKLLSHKPNDTPGTSKRKLDDDGTTVKQSGVSKLAKFGFKK